MGLDMPKRQDHTWGERTPDGIHRYCRASRFRGQWRLASKLDGEDFWTREDPIAEGDLRSLRDVLWRKYQRRRLPWEHVAEIDRLLGEDEV